jgi:hypothetical protein
LLLLLLLLLLQLLLLLLLCLWQGLVVCCTAGTPDCWFAASALAPAL